VRERANEQKVLQRKRMKKPSMKLVHYLIGKSIAETTVVGILAVFFFVTVFPPYFHGWGQATAAGISGWVVDNGAPWDRVEVQLFIDGKFVANGIANLSRPDVLAAGWSRDEWHGYTFSVGRLDAGVHQALVYAMHESGKGARRTLQAVGDPIRFSVANDGTLSDLSTPKR
jgi:hypothetical protein